MFTTPFYPPVLGHFNPVAEQLAPLFRVLDTAVTELAGAAGPNDRAERAARHHQRQTASFTPRFDVREVGSSYELQGELPGIEQKDLAIEFVDDKTLVIRGRSVREYENENSNVDGGVAAAAAAVAGKGNTVAATADDDAASEKSANYHKASVEDEDDFVDAGAEATAEKSSSSPSSAVAAAEAAKGKAAEETTAEAATDPDTSVPPETKASEPQFKYWVSERSIGEFERRFAFPGRVDQEAVKASLRNGILSIVVPKIVEQGARRIQIQ